MHVPDVKLDGTPANTQVYIEVDLPTTDNIMGWVYNLQYIPYGDTAQAVAVTASGSQDIYTQRTDAVRPAAQQENDPRTRLAIPLPKLGQLTCGSFGTCSSTAGGRFKLAQLKSLSWFDSDDAAVLWDDVATGNADAVASAAATSYLTGSFGSPPVAGAWDATFYVGKLKVSACHIFTVCLQPCRWDALAASAGLLRALHACRWHLFILV